MLKLIIGRAGTGKSTRLLQRICQQNDGRHILLVPDPQSHASERRLCAEGGAGVCRYAEVLTFSGLANRVFQTAGGAGRQELDAGGRLLLMWRAVRSVSDVLAVYTRPSQRPAFLSGLLATADELKSCCVTPEQMLQAGENIGGNDGARLRDLGLICAAYDAMAANIALDPHDRLSRAAEKLLQCDWGSGVRVWLDGFIDFTPQQLEIIRLLLQRGECVTVALTCDKLEETDGGAGIFSPARYTARQLIAMAQKLGQSYEVEVCDQPSPARSNAMVQLEQRLFAAELGQAVSCDGRVQLFCGSDPRTEVEWTAAQIRKLVRENDLRMRDIAVVARSYDRYDGLVESVFSRYDIPVFRSAMSDILQRPVMSLVTAALDVVAGGYAYDDVFRYLKTDLTDLTREERDKLENYALKWDIHGSRWTQEKPWAMNPGGYDGEMNEAAVRLLEELDALRRKVVAPLEKMRANRLKTGRGQAKALYILLEEIGLDKRLEERCDLLTEQGELGLAQEYRQLWEILCGALEQCANLLDDMPLELDEFARLLRLVLSQYEVGTIPVSLDRVTAGELVRQSGHGVKALFILGADNASIPGVGQPSGLLTDDDRELLAGEGVELGLRGKDRLYREMTAIYTACTCPDEMLFVTRPAQNGGETLEPSFLVERLLKLFSDLQVQTEGAGEFRLCAPQAALEQAGHRPAVRRVLGEMPRWSGAVQRLDRAEHWERGSLSRQTVDRLYGRRVSMSATRMDQCKACHFAHFMRYGLKAEPRKRAGFDAPAYGTFVHYVVEHVFQSDAWRDGEGGVNQDKLKELTRAAVEDYIQNKLGGLEHQTPRFVYLFRRLIGGVDAVVENAAQELAVSRFVPVDFELGFGQGEELDAVELTEDGVTLGVTGYVDRVDAWKDGDQMYLRVVDYKTGSKTFDLTEVAGGMGLQMLLYLFTLCREGEKRYGVRPIPAGVLYVPAKDVIIHGTHTMTEEERRKKVDSKLRRRGLVLDDQAVLDAMEQPGEKGPRFLPTGKDCAVSARRLARLERHVERVLRDICAEIAAGNIAADPYWRGPEQNACRYCEFAAACHFEEGRSGDRLRRVHTVKAEEFWDEICPGKDLPEEEACSDEQQQ